MRQLKGKTAIISGGGTGIGEGVAVALAAQGVKLVLCGRRSLPLAHVTQHIQEAGGECIYMTADVSVATDVERLIEKAVDNYGSVHILINNAGISGGRAIHEHSIEMWDKIMAVNLRGPFLMSRAVLPLMRKQKQGHIINISSESALEYYPGDGAYGVAKHALNALGEYIQRENQAYGIHVDSICPGMVVTEMTEHARNLDHAKCLLPQDIADLVLWLLSRRANIKIGRPILIQTMENPWKT